MSFERRKGNGVRHLDRRRTYMDIMERVLGSSGMLSQRSPQRSRFEQVNLVTPPFAAAVASIEVRVLDSIYEPA
jgi:hypothetical protein